MHVLVPFRIPFLILVDSRIFAKSSTSLAHVRLPAYSFAARRRGARRCGGNWAAFRFCLKFEGFWVTRHCHCLTDFSMGALQSSKAPAFAPFLCRKILCPCSSRKVVWRATGRTPASRSSMVVGTPLFPHSCVNGGLVVDMFPLPTPSKARAPRHPGQRLRSGLRLGRAVGVPLLAGALRGAGGAPGHEGGRGAGSERCCISASGFGLVQGDEVHLRYEAAEL